MSLKRNGSFLVAAGILLSRIMGLVRQKIFAHYFGNSDAGDAFYAALKIPNFMQNLLGDGVLSASFIPVYSRMLAKDEKQAADEVAGIVGSILALLNAALVCVGIVATPYLIDLVAPGFEGEKRDLTIRLVQILFPGTGLLCMSAWCLGILNSHRRFFLSYAAPVIWNAAIIAALLAFGRLDQSALAVYTAWGVFAGSLLQFAVQLPTTLRCASAMRFAIRRGNAPVNEIFKNTLPVVIARGVVQISAYVDNVLASLLPTGAVSALAYSQSLYMLPISLFGMSVSAAELPAMSGIQGTSEEIAIKLRDRINAGLRQISFFVVPSVIGFLILGDVIVAGLFQGGEFQRENTIFVWAVLAGSTLGLLATTRARLYSSAFYSIKDTTTPLKFAMVRVGLTIALGYVFAFELTPKLGLIPLWGTAGITLAGGVVGWIEYVLLRSFLASRIGKTGVPAQLMLKLWASALIAAATAWTSRSLVQSLGLHPIVTLFAVLAPYGVVYFAITSLLSIDESTRIVDKILRRQR